MEALNYKDKLTDAMTWLGEQPDTFGVGYNLKYSHAGGTMKGFPNDRIVEMPLAEALMMGTAIGMSLDGWIPIVWVERMDFMSLMVDQIVSHLDKIAQLSEGIHRPACIIRACVGNKDTPLFTGPTHTQNFSMMLRHALEMPVIELKWSSSVLPEYQKAYNRAKQGKSTILTEFKDLYNEP